MNIELAQEQDLAEILTLQKRAFTSEAQYYGDFSIPPMTQTLGEIREEWARKIFLKAEIDGRLVGSVRIGLTHSTAEVGRLIVAPELQGRGIGRSLLAAAESVFPEAERLELFTGVSSERTIRIYERSGYHRMSERITGTGVALLFMEKRRPRTESWCEKFVALLCPPAWSPPDGV